MAYDVCLQCVYAHGASELKNRPIVSTLEYIKTKQKKAIPDKKKPPQEDLSLLESDIDVSTLGQHAFCWQHIEEI